MSLLFAMISCPLFWSSNVLNTIVIKIVSLTFVFVVDSQYFYFNQ